MSLLITKVSVSDFRNYERFELCPDECLTLLVGENATGKTNLVEAVQLLTAAESFRVPAWADTVRWGSEAAALSLEAEGDSRFLKTELSISQAGKRAYRVNGKAKRRVGDVAGLLPCVLFTPDDLRLVKDSAERRRVELDGIGVQLSATYGRLKAEYERVLRQRNALLRDTASDARLLEPLTTQLADLGARLTTHRRGLFARIEKAMVEVHQEITPAGTLTAEYLPSWARDGLFGAEEDPVIAMEGALTKRSRDELTRGTSLVGPHRDEMVFYLQGKDARVFASQGQQRTIALAWKLAEVAVVTEVSGQPPVLLLDDVMSELDANRRHALASFVGRVAQTIVTTTNLDYFDPQLVERSKVVVLS